MPESAQRFGPGAGKCGIFVRFFLFLFFFDES
jgi:hypothetical protein